MRENAAITKVAMGNVTTSSSMRSVGTRCEELGTSKFLEIRGQRTVSEQVGPAPPFRVLA